MLLVLKVIGDNDAYNQPGFVNDDPKSGIWGYLAILLLSVWKAILVCSEETIHQQGSC